ncbi:MAG: SBBP repeat-containing protein, partial [Candidatus Odinarchaeota archaeon]
MKKKYMSFIIVLVLPLYAFSFTEPSTELNTPPDSYLLSPSLSSPDIIVEWNLTWGWSANDWGDDIAIDKNNNLYLAGTTNSFGAGDDDIFIAKFDTDGQQKWNDTWGGFDHDWSYGVDVDSYGDIYIAGRWNRSSSNLGDLCLVKFSSGGSYLWDETIWGSEEDTYFDIFIDTTDTIYIAGKSLTWSYGNSDGIIDKFDTDGNNPWAYYYGDIEYESFTAIIGDNDGYIYVAGVTNSTGEGGFDVFLMKIDSAGYWLWNATWGGSGDDIAQGIAADNLGNLYICGYTDSFSVSGKDAFLIKYDDTGNYVWNKTLNLTEDEFFYDIIVGNDGYIYVCGETNTLSSGGADMVLIKYTSSGNEVWTKTWGGNEDDWGTGLVMDADGNIYISGDTFSFGPGGLNAFLIKVIENFAPVISSPADISFIEKTENNCTWTVTDETVSTPTYIIYRNTTTSVATGEWISGDPIFFNLSAYTVGSYNFTIIAYDGYGKSCQDDIIVDVLPEPPSKKRDKIGGFVYSITLIAFIIPI